MKPRILLLSMTLSALTLPSMAVELPSGLTEQLKQSKKVEEVKSNALLSYAANKLGMSEEKVASGLGSLFKVAKDNLSKDNFTMLSSAIPDINSYINQAPESSKSAITSLFGSNDTTKKVESANYLDSAFKKLGIPKESLPTMVNTVTGYLESNGYGEAAGMLKKGLTFL
ncbi:MAG: DUF2780 domain-containing protein [Colwellia sp.]|nr:DUF2780 domain-containing protein [Colwellia sp.]MCW9083023.1 DUF2780 domain-containing protein [Colwellia sp.]